MISSSWGRPSRFSSPFETRLKRGRALSAINELRALAHIIDMHQLTKDPETTLRRNPTTDVSPARNLSPFELSRYLDYCSELLALVSKVGALYVQSFPDSQALSAVDEIESLTTGLSRKIWQKIMILDRYVERDEKRPPPSSRNRPPLLEARPALGSPDPHPGAGRCTSERRPGPR
jgi:hypothetical protein